MNNDRRLALVLAIAIGVVFVVFRFNFSPLLLFVAAAICILICFFDLMSIEIPSLLGLNPTTKPMPNKSFLRTRPTCNIYKPPISSSSTVARGTKLWGKSVDLNNLNNIHSPLNTSGFLDGGGSYILARRRLEAARRNSNQVPKQTQVSRHGSVLASVMNTKMFQERLQCESTSNTPPQRNISYTNTRMMSPSPRVTVKIANRVTNLQHANVVRVESATVANRSVAEALRLKRKTKSQSVDAEDCSPSEKKECREDAHNPFATLTSMATVTLPNGLACHGVDLEEITPQLTRPGILRKRAAVVTPLDGYKLAKRTKTNEILCSYSSSRRIVQRVKGRTRIYRTETGVPVTNNELVNVATSTYVEDDPVDDGTVTEKQVEVDASKVGLTPDNLHRPLTNTLDAASKGPKSRKQRLGIYDAIKSPRSPDGVYVPSYVAGVEDHVRDGLVAHKRLSSLMGTKSAQVTAVTSTTMLPLLATAIDTSPPVNDTVAVDGTSSSSNVVGFSIPPLATTTTTSAPSIGGFSFGFGSKATPTYTDKRLVETTVSTSALSTTTVSRLTLGTGTNPCVSLFGGGSNAIEKSAVETKASESLATTFGVAPVTPLTSQGPSLGPSPETLFQFGTGNPTSTSVTFSNGTRTSPMSLPSISTNAVQATKTNMEFNFGSVAQTPLGASPSGPFTVGDGTSSTAQPFLFGQVSSSAAVPDATQSGGYSFNFGAQPSMQFGGAPVGGVSGPTMFSTGTGSTMPRRRRQVGARPRSHR